MHETENTTSTATAAEQSEGSVTADELAAQTFEGMTYEIPSREKYMADALEMAKMLPFLQAVLSKNDRELEGAVRQSPEANLELLDWFCVTAGQLQRNAEALRVGVGRLGVALGRIEIESREGTP